MNPEKLFENIAEILQRLKKLEERPAPATMKEVETLQNKGINLDAKKVAEHLSPSLLNRLPDAKAFEQSNAGFAHSLKEEIRQVKQEAIVKIDNAFFLLFLGVVLFFILSLWGCIHYYFKAQHYQEDAYKYNFYKKQTYLMPQANIGDFNYLDSLAVRNFAKMENYVDTADVEKILHQRQAKRLKK